MTIPSVPIFSVGCDPTRNEAMEDDLSTSTPPISHRNSDDDHELVSKTIRFFFAPADYTRIDTTHPTVIHTQWIKNIQSAFGDDVKFLNNHNRPVQNIDMKANKHNINSHSYQFQLHAKSKITHQTTETSYTAVTIIHRILTRIPLSQIKRHPSAYKLLTENNCYLNEHKWDEQEWDVQQFGFVTGFNPKYYSPERATTKFRARLCKAFPRNKLPKFQLVLKTHRITYNGRSSSTQAFSIEAATASISKLLPLIKEATKDTKDFVPFQMRRKNPEAFQGAIRFQNHLLANQHVVMINSLGTDAMYYLSDRIQAIPGVKDVIPTKNVEISGRFYVLVDKSDANRVRESLGKNFDQWYLEVVPEDAKPKEGTYQGPPGVASPRSDGYSSGDNTWMTTSTRGSFMMYSVASMETSTSNGSQSLDRAWETRPAVHSKTTETSASYQPTQKKPFASYAAATVSDQVSGITESEQIRDARHEELRSKIDTLEALVVQLCHQVQALTANVAPPPARDAYDSPHGKRPDLQDTPRKHKKPHNYSAASDVEEDTNERAPMNDDHLTVWDDYESKSTNDPK
jgi:hypothetical protein